jgi:hypothetical protein
LVASDPSGGNIDVLGTINVTGGGTWHWYNMRYTETAAAAGRAGSFCARPANTTGTYWVDGIQAEAGSVTTYIDGDQMGGTWTGAAHQSPSFRSGQYRGGGSIVALADLGLQVDQFPGAGMPPVENSARATRSRMARSFSASAPASAIYPDGASRSTAPAWPTSMSRAARIWDAFKPDLVTHSSRSAAVRRRAGHDRQLTPTTTRAWSWATWTARSPRMRRSRSSRPIRTGTRPRSRAPRLAARASLGSVNFLAYRDPGARSAAMAQLCGRHSGNAAIYAVENIGGTVIFGGFFGSVAGTGVAALGSS